MLGIKVCTIFFIFCYGAKLSSCQGVSTLLTLSEVQVNEICPGFEFQFVAHPTSQQNYVICVAGGGVEKECAATQCFDERNPPCSATCSTTTFAAADQATKDHCNDDETPILDRVANDKDCQSYYICVGKNIDPLPQKCPVNQHFSDEHKTCLNFYEANCAASSKWCKKKKDGIRFPHIKCHEYYECQNETAVATTCPYGEHFAKNLSKCVSGICREDKRTPSCKGVEDGVRMIHAKCYKYYVCLNQSLFEIQCANGYFFDKTQSLCVRDVNNVCAL